MIASAMGCCTGHTRRQHVGIQHRSPSFQDRFGIPRQGQSSLRRLTYVDTSSPWNDGAPHHSSYTHISIRSRRLSSACCSWLLAPELQLLDSDLLKQLSNEHNVYSIVFGTRNRVATLCILHSFEKDGHSSLIVVEVCSGLICNNHPAFR